MSPSRLRTLVVFVHYPETLSYFVDWLDAFTAEPSLEVVRANLATPWGRRRLREHASDVDLIVLLHSVVGDSLTEIRRCAPSLHDRHAPIVAFVSNEVSLPTQPFGAKIEMLRNLAPEYVCTQLLLETSEYLYAETGAKVVAMPHALNPDSFRSETPHPKRPIDVGFRGARYFPHVGDDERNRIIDYFASASFDPPLVADVRTEVPFARRGWARFLNRCKGTIGAESGSVYMSRGDDILDHAERSYRVQSADLRVRRRLRPVHRYLPRTAKTVLRRTADHLAGRRASRHGSDAFLEPLDAPPGALSGKCLSSRHFDAIGTETCQILFPGRYNDLFVPDQHYLCLEPDFSNVDDVLARFREESLRVKLVHEARQWALDGHTYAHRVRSLLDAVGAR